MANCISGDAPGIVVASAGGSRTFLHRYEVIVDDLVRRPVAEQRPLVDDEVRLVDVLVSEDEIGRYVGAVRGVIVHERDLARLASATDLIPWREFEVGIDLMLNIGQDLGVGPHQRPALRLATSNGLHVA